MKIYVIGSDKDKFLNLDSIRTKFYVNEKHKELNIDFLNPWYCEVTGLYHLINNTNDMIIGLEHYRRYFFNSDGNLLNELEIEEQLKNNDIICSKYTYPRNLTPLYYLTTNKVCKKFLPTFLDAIEDEKFKAFLIDKWKTAKWFCSCNMFIGKREIVEKWLNWFLSISTKFSSSVFFNLPRVIGYMAEFTFGFWLEYNGYKITFSDVYCFDKNLSKIYEKNLK